MPTRTTFLSLVSHFARSFARTRGTTRIASLAFLLALAVSPAAHATTDAYRQWAVSKWGITIASADNTRSTTWGENADPDHDGIPNLVEYLADTNPNARNPLSDVYTYSVPGTGAPSSRYQQLLAWLRTDDPDLRVICQTSTDLFTWLPAAPADLSLPQPPNPYIGEMETGIVSRGLRQVRYTDLLSLNNRSAAFMRILVIRRGQSVASPAVDPFSFTSGQAAPGSTARSSAVTLGGFVGTISITIPSGVTLFVNGIAQTGPTAQVKAGDTLWMQATAPGTAGATSNYTLTIGGQSATWNFTTAAIAAVPDHPGTDSGYTPVETGVSDTGAAQISIPIVVSPGTAGMQPKLSINYSSQGGNGPLGVGFSLSGLSTISRVGRTVAQDGVKGGVNFDANDRFALDGQRLIAINGADGADGTEYRLEFDPTSRIRSYGTEGSGPQRWVVETKAGLTMEFGLNANSRIKPEGGTSALAWAIEKITDTAANSMLFSYEDTARQRGEILVITIAYTSNAVAGLTANQSVIFEYEDRPDARTSYAAGFAVKSLKRMTAIESRALDGVLMKRVRRYVPTYQQAEISGASQITQIQETTTDGTQLPASTFDWAANSSANQTVITNTGITAIPPFDRSPPAPVMAGDFNADGILDMFKMNDHLGVSQPGNHWIALGNADGVFSYTTPVADLQNKRLSDAGEGSRMRSCDINGDGKTDMFHLYYVAGLENFAALSRGDGTFQIIPKTQLGDLATLGFTPGAFSEFLMIDVNGDGRSDAVYIEQNKHFVAIGNGDGSFTKVANIGGLSACNYGSDVTGGGGSWLLPGDYNGDGFADLLHIYYHSGAFNWIALSQGNGSFDVRHQANVTGIPLTTVDNTSTHYLSADFNGDGLTDVLCLKAPSNTNGWLAISKGDGTFQRIDTVSGISGAPTGDLSSSHFVAGDFNGDGFTDVFHARAGAPNDAWMAFSKGDGTFTRISGAALGGLNGKTYSSGIDSKVFAGDYDGDGTEDILHLQYSGANYLARSNGFDSARVTKVTNGHGGYTSFGYKPLTDPSVYTKRTGAVYPCYDMQMPMQVVSSITSRNGIDGDGFTQPPVSPVGENIVSYQYEGAWSCLDGRGFMGFKYVTVTDQASGIITQKQFLNTNPLLASQATSQIVYLPDGRNISRADTTSTLQQVNYTVGGRINSTYFVYASDSTTRSFEINQGLGASYFKKTRVYNVNYDAVGNLLQSTTETVPLGAAQTFTETVTNTYSDTISPTRWLLGRLATSSVTKTGPNPDGAGTESLTRASSFSYHPTTGLLTQEVIEPNETTLRQQKDYTHDGFGNILTSTISTSGAASRITTTTYTPDGRFVATTTNALNHTESKTYDPLLGNVLTQTGPNNLTTTWNYDAIGRPIQENRPDGTVTRSFYRLVTGSTVGAPPRAVHYVRVQSSGGSPKTVWYDLLDREIRADGIAFDGRTVSSHKVFNNRGEVTHASQPYFAGDTPLYSQMLYDAVGRETQQTDPGNRVTKTTYDGLTTTVERNYNPAALTDFQKAVTVVNAMGWTVQSSQYLGTAAKTITRKYDPYGNLRFVTDPANNTTELRYDLRGNKTYMSEPNSGTSTFTYNGFGELKTQTNAANQTVSLTYDKLGRVLTRTEPEGVTTFEYDSAAKGIGQLARESSGDFVRSYFYDHLSRPVGTVESHGFHSFAVSRSYDSYGRPDAMTYPTGLATRQVYTANGHLSEVQNAATTQLYWRALAANARGQITQEVQGNGVVTDRAFDANTGLIDGITSTLNAAGDVQKAEFDFDLIGNLTARRDKRYSTTFSETFGYDTLNRLQTVTTTGAAAVTATYDDLGNITSRTDVGTLHYATGGAGPHALTRVRDGGFNKDCFYDAKGNRTADGATTIDYSSFNKPVRMVKGGDTLRFDYGPDRALYRQTTFLTQPGGATSQTVREYIGGLYERETTSEGLVRHIHYIAGGSGVAAILTDERSASTTAQRTRYIHKDHLGSVDVITDSAGAVVERQSFDAWGRRRTVAYNTGTSTWSVTYPATPGSAETHRGFTGHEMLDAVGLVHMGGRIYDPITARFLSPDPFVQSPDNLQNLNRYSYVLNNPLSFTDPSGFFFKGLGKFLKNNWKTIAAIGVGVITGGLAAWAVVPGVTGIVSGVAAVATGAGGLAGAIAGGAGFGFGSAFSGTLLAGGSIGDALRAGLTGGVIGGATAGLIHGASTALGLHNLSTTALESGEMTTGQFAGKVAEKVAVHGVISGASSIAQGGKFIHGFLSGGAAGFASPFIAGAGLSGAGQVAAAAAVGGTASALGGGKFSNGAVSGAFVYLFNEGIQSVGQPGTLESFIPFWGAGRAMMDDLQNGNYWAAAGDAGLLVIDGVTLGAGGAALKVGARGLGFVGKASSRLAISEAEVAFGHGARHLAGSGLSTATVENAIRQDVRALARTSDGGTGAFWGRVNIGGSTITYRAHTLSDGTIHVGTYYLPR